MERKEVIKDGIKFWKALGMALAVTLSWSVNKSIVWAIIHGCISWAYVVYYAITK